MTLTHSRIVFGEGTVISKFTHTCSLELSCMSIRRLISLTFYRRNLICFTYGISPYRDVNTFHHGYKNQSVNGV